MVERAGRIAQRAADVVAQSDRAHAAGERRGFAAAGAACCPIGVPGITGETVQRVEGVRA